MFKSSIAAPKNGTSTVRQRKVVQRKTGALKNWCIALATVASFGLCFHNAHAQGGQPQPTPGLEDVATISLSSNKGSVCAGGVGSPVHQATLVATAKNKDGRVLSGKSISFTVQNADAGSAPDEVGSLSASNPTSGSPLTVTTNANGDATVTFTSSRVIGASNIVKASSNGKEAQTTIDMADESGTITIDKTELIADGVDFTYLRLPLTSGGGAVDGHSISWRISKVTYEDENGAIVVVAPSEYSNYGSIEASSTTGADGEAKAKYTTGTSGGTIEFEADDTSVSVKGGGTGGLGSQSAASASSSSTRGSKKFDYSAAKSKSNLDVRIRNVDARSPASTSIWCDVWSGTLSKVTLYGPGFPNGVDSFPTTTTFFMTFNQRDVLFGTNNVTLICTSTSGVVKRLTFTVTRTGKNKISSGAASISIPDDDIGRRLVACSTAYYENYSKVTYSVPLVTGSKTVRTDFARASYKIAKSYNPIGFGAQHEYADGVSRVSFFKNYMDPGTYPELLDPNASEVEFKKYLATDSFFESSLLGGVDYICRFANLDGAAMLVQPMPGYRQVSLN